jgi:hypothetical protein
MAAVDAKLLQKALAEFGEGCVEVESTNWPAHDLPATAHQPYDPYQ